MDLNTAWFLLMGFLLVGYAVLDGFDLGVGVLHLFARNERERRLGINAIGPVWDGNEVWLITAGGALFAAFPPVYATVFSGFYLALVLVLVALIARAVSMEFRGQVASPAWRRVWDWAFALGSLLAAVLFGVAFGNVAGGVPVDAQGNFAGTFLGLLNPYALLAGVLSLVVFVMHGAAYMLLKTSDDFQARMARFATGAWMASVVLFVLLLIVTFFAAPFLFEAGFKRVWFWVFGALALGALLVFPLAVKAGKDRRAFLASALFVVSLVGLPAACMYPRLVPSSIDLAHSLTIYNASSTPRTLLVMLVIALVGMPLVIVYTAVIYRMFKGKTVLTEESY